MSVSEFMWQSVMERIENEYDLTLYNKAMDKYKNNPVTYSLDKVERAVLKDKHKPKK